jgi:3-oxoacyl-[acyl-carrier-protein] synthase II
MKRRVVVTGIGLICGQAMSAQELFDRIKAHRSSVRINQRLAAYGVAASACSFVDESVLHELALHYADCAAQAGPPALLALYAADQALANARLDIDSVKRKGLFVASNKQAMEAEDLVALAQHLDPLSGKINLDSFLTLEQHNPDAHFHRRQDTAAALLADRFGIDDVIMTPSDACAAGGVSVGMAYQHIASGKLDAALAGAAETMCSYIPVLSFAVLGALAPQAAGVVPEAISRPFDKARNGFVMGDGSAILVLEAEEHALARGAKILGYISGFSKHTEAWRITSSRQDGSDYARCMRDAITDAGLSLEDIDHINAHGTSTEQNDSCESMAIKKLFASRAASIPVTSNKSAIGHSLAASGAIEAAMSILSLHHQMLLPTLNYEAPDDDTAGIDVVKTATAAPIRHVLSNSFGFGGENSALVMSAV